MNLRTPCFDCLLSHLDMLIEREGLPGRARREILAKLDRAVRAAGEIPPTDLMREFHHVLRGYTGDKDLFREEKILSTEFALRLLPEVRRILEGRPAWEDLLKIVVSGNIIDYGADSRFTMDRALEVISAAVDRPVDQAAAGRFRQAVQEAGSIFYIADNCGEAVFDRLLLERMAGKVTLGVRGRPILNDLTPAEIAISGLQDFPVVDTGDDTPGVSLRHSSAEFLRHLRHSDLVVAKGQGNYESLSELDRPITFLLCVKCKVISECCGRPVGTLLIDNHNLDSPPEDGGPRRKPAADPE